MVLNFLKTGYAKVKSALTKTGSLLGQKLRSLFQGKIDEETLEELEQLFYESDLGVKTAVELTERVKEIYRKDPSLEGEALIQEIRNEITQVLQPSSARLADIPKEKGPLVILVVGVNGNGKTTSVAKLAKRFQEAGNKVLVAAADTFRAAAVEQLDMWAKRIGADIVKGAPNCDPAAVAFDALSAGKARDVDVILIDTAGRLQTRTDLMQELQKIKRTCHKLIPNSPHETLLVLDATIGQNAVDQAKIFHQFTPVSGLILTKLDGSSKGGVVVSIQRELGIPVKFIGVGEGVEDFEPFDPESFASALLD